MKYLISRILMPIVALALLCGPVMADDWSGLNAKKQTRLGLYMTPQQAEEYVQANPEKSLFVDIRSPEELMFLGSPDSIDAHVPYEFVDITQWNETKSEYMMAVNKNFVADIGARVASKGLGKDDVIILMCRSGNRSAKAVNLLADAGYTRVYNLAEGYEGDKAKEGPDKGKRTVNGWKNAGLPWTYHLDKSLMYMAK